MGTEPNPNYRHNPNRAIYVHGRIESDLVQKLTGDILSLQNESRSPITVYIDSPGGDLSAASALWRLLTASNQNNDKPCRIITVVTTRAASAAADLLSSGDYALAHPQSAILYHGSRMYFERPLTMEFSSAVSRHLRAENDKYAMDLLRKIEDRFMLRLMFSSQHFENIRKKHPGAKMTDAECFLSLVNDKLSPEAKNVFAEAKRRRDRYDSLINSVVKKSHKSKSKTKTEANRIKAIVDFERESNKKFKNWTFLREGLPRINDDFFLINEYLAISESERLAFMCERWGTVALSDKERLRIEKISDDNLRKDKLIRIVRPKLIPLWTFFVALCHVLQEGENELTAKDAFWLGLIDEIIGVDATAELRKIIEHVDDSAPKQDPVVQSAESK
jgi:ATP-dependent protease ClpP protease subunit